jgi:LPXTG-site transpeptidase (sortase) family protein
MNALVSKKNILLIVAGVVVALACGTALGFFAHGRLLAAGAEYANPEPGEPLRFFATEQSGELPGAGIPVPYPDDGLPDPADDLPQDKLFVTAERQLYKEKDLTLVIPAMDFEEPVYDGTDKATLKKGACLYEVSQLPGKGNRNVSIAGHRNSVKNGKIIEIMFYHLDKLGEGDYLYLYDGEKVYRYLYEFTVVVEENDWSQIYSQGYSCLTLTTCTPIGVADHRLIVRAALDGIFYYADDFEFAGNVSD